MYTAFSSASTRSASASASAPPEPPSLSTTLTVGVRRPSMQSSASAIAHAWPRSSAPIPACAAGVSTRQTTGIENFSAWRMSRTALRYPSGWGIPKLWSARVIGSVPFS